MDEVDASEEVEASETTTETVYTDEELAEYRALFDKFDRDGNESIETSELGDALRYLGCNPLDTEVEAMIAEADGKSNDNGRLEFSEFCEIIATNKKSLEQEQEELKAAFRHFDKDGSGSIDREELKQVIMDLGMWEGMTEGELDEMMDAADKNGDGNGNGTIEFNELVRVMTAIDND